MKIVYESKTGFTEKYALMLGQRLDITPVKLKDYIPKENDEIIFLSWISAGQLKNLKNVKDKCKIKCVGAVGLTAGTEKDVTDLITANKLEGINVFYLRGGVDFTKLKGFIKFLMKMIVKHEIKNNTIVGDKEVILSKGIDYVNQSYLEDMIKFLSATA